MSNETCFPSMKYKLPEALQKEFSEDLALRKIQLEGERSGKTIVQFLQAVIFCLLSRSRFLFIELGRYHQKYGPLPEINGEPHQQAHAKEEQPGDTESPQESPTSNPESQENE